MAGTTYTLRPWTFNTNDMSFLYSQVTFIPLFDAVGNPIINWDGTTNAFLSNGTQILGSTAVDALGNNLNVLQYGVSYVSVTDLSGLRNLTGQNNNLTAGQTHWGQVMLPFPRMVPVDFANYLKPADPTTGVGAPTLSDVATAQVQAVDATYGTALTNVDGTPMLVAGTGAFTLTGALNANLTPTAVANSSSAFDVAAAAQANSATYINSGSFYAKQFDPTKITFKTDYSTTGSGGFSSNGSQGQATATPLVVNQLSVVDYTPRMISMDTTTAGVTFAKDANGKIAFNEGVAVVTDWGQLSATTGSGQLDYQNLSGNTVVTNNGLTVYKHVLSNGAWVATTQPFTITNTQAALHFSNGSTVIDPITHNPIVIDGANLLAVDPTTGVVTPTLITNAVAAVGATPAIPGTVATYSDGTVITDPTVMGPRGPVNPPPSIILNSVAEHHEEFIGGINPGVAPNNGYFALFGQFFDHGLDFIGKGAQHTSVKIALATSDPLYIAPGNPNDGFGGMGNTSMTISRANVSGFDTTGTTTGNPNYLNHSSPYIDQSQTYGSDNSKINLLREWVSSDGGVSFHAGANLLDGYTATTWTDGLGNNTNSTLPTLNELRAHLVATGRDDLTWDDISGLRNRDAGGHVITGAGAGTGDAILLDMNPHFDATHFATWTKTPPAIASLTGAAAGVATATNIIAAINAQAIADNLPFAAGGGVYNANSPVATISMGNIMIGAGPGMASLSDFINFATFQPKAGLSAAMTALVQELLIESIGDHYIAGDGRANENVGLTSIHHVWHEEHNYQVAVIEQSIQDQDTQAVINGDTSHDTLHKWQIATGFTDANGNYLQSANGPINWDSDKIFNGAKVTVEMEYQHVAVDQYSRSVTPDIPEFVGYNSSLNANVTNEYGQVAFRFGHSTLRETIDTMDPTGGLTGKIMSYALKDAFLNPALYSQVGAGAITLGMTHQQMNEVDEFLTPAMNQGLLGQPLDLAAINIARGRDMGLPTLNEMRVAIGKIAYTNWSDFGSHMLHSSNLAGFIAAYSMDGDLDRANALVNVFNGGVDSVYGYTDQSATDFMTNNHDVDKVDAWLGGLAEMHVLGGLLGETFNYIFLDQIERLMDGDRFYYLYRMAGLQIGEQMVNEQFKDIVERNTGLTHLNGNVFAYADAYYDESQQASSSNIVVQGREHKYADVMATYEAANTASVQKNVGIYSVGSVSTGGVNAELGNGAIKAMTTIIHNEGAQNMTHSDFSTQQPGATLATVLEKYVYDVRPDVMHGQTALDGMPVSGDGSIEVLVGSNYDDVLFMGEGDDTAYGDGGNDIIFGGGGMDKLYGGAGNDTLYGGEGPDVMDGGAGDDVIFGDASGTAMNGTDQLIGGFGNDTIYGGIGIDKISGEAGDDVIYGGADTDPFTHGGDGNDYIDGGTGGDLLYGDAGDDVLVGGSDQDVSYGGSGDDIIRPGAPSQALVGAGVDEAVGGQGLTTETAADYGFNLMDLSDWAAGAPGVNADFATQAAPALAANGTAADFPAWFQIQGLIATANNDTVIGDDTGNWIIGGSGNDTVIGGAGSDIIVGNHIRLDSLIGNYQVNGVQAGYGYTAFDTATHRAGTGVYGQGGVAATLATSGDMIDAANTALGSQVFDKHFTEMLKTAMFKDTVLGNDVVNSNGSGVGLDTAVYSGNFADYDFKTVVVNTAHEGAILGTLISDKVVNGVDEVVANGGVATSTDLVIGMTYLQFKDIKITITNLGAPLFTGVTPTTSVDENSTAVIETFNVTSFTGNPFTVKLGNTADDALFSIVDNLNGTFSLVANGTGLNYENLTHYGIPYNLDIIATDSVNGFLNSTNVSVTALNVDEVSTGNIALTGGYTSGDTGVATVSQVTVSALNTLLDPDLVRPGTALTTSGKVVDQTLSTVNPQPANTANPYQWQSSTNLGTTWTNVANQNAAALSVNSSNTVTEYRVVSSYADVFGVHNATTDPLTAISGVAVIGTSNIAGDSLTGTANDDLILALNGNDTINGYTGADTVDGGAGVDTLQISDATNAAAISVALDTRVLNVEVITAAAATAGVTLDLHLQTETFTSINGSAFADVITGPTSINNRINAGAGNDTIVGFATGNTVDGGTGADSVQINSTADATAISLASNAALANVEIITAAGSNAAVTLNLANQTEALSIIGSNFDDTVVGFITGDTVEGGTGLDTIQITTTGNATAISGALDAALTNVEVITAAGVTGTAGVTLNLSTQTDSFTSIIGSNNADVITTSATVANAIYAGAGNDTVVGFATGNTVDGGAGADIIQINSAAAAAAISAATDAAVANVEVISAATSAAGVTLNVSAQTEALSIIGSNSNDTIVGFATGNSVDGGTGSDRIQLNSAADATAISAASNTALANVEIITAVGSNAAVTLNLANQTEALSIIGSNFADTFVGYTTLNTVDGGTGTDTIQINSVANAAAISAASNAALANVEIITAAGSNAAVTLNLTNQSEALSIIGSALADAITGGTGNDTIVGYTTGDSVIGGNGTDTIQINSTADAAAISLATDAALATVEVISAAAATVGVTLNVAAQTEALSIIGSGFADTIVGYATGNSVDGGAGTDTIQINTAAAATAISAASNAAIANVEIISAAGSNASVTLNLANQTEALSIIGSNFADTFVGYATGNSVDGGTGTDTIQINSAANASAISLATDAALTNVEIISAAASNAGVSLNLAAQTEALSVIGSNLADTIIGFATGESVNGGTGTDTIQINTAANAAAISAALDTAVTNVEVITATAATAGVILNLSAQTEALSIIGSAFADTIVGYATGNSVDGGAGTDTIQIITATDANNISAASNAALANVEVITAATATTGVTLNLAAQTEVLSIIGSTFADTFVGYTAGNSVDGGAGADTIQINSAANATAISGATDAALVNVEVITAAASNAAVTLNLAAQTEALSIIGSGFADTIVGYATGNSVDGGAGIDTIQINTAAAATAISAASNAAIANVETITAAGSNAAVTLNLANQTEALSIVGSAFADTIVGFVTSDSVDGGAGVDTIQINTAAAATAISAASNAALANVEIITAAGSNAAVTLNLANQTEALSIIGSALADAITGGTGNDTIFGFTTGDSVTGGNGTDTIQINTVADATAIAAASNAAIATVEVISAAAATLGLTLNLSTQTEALSIIGSGFADTIVGFVTGDSVDGGVGVDTIQINSAANATAISAATNAALANVEVITAAAANAAVTLNMAAQTEALTIIGSANIDTIIASSGGDSIKGGAGNDILTGGAGIDTFAFETTAALNGLDTINTFAKANDILQVSSFFTATPFNTTNVFSNGTTTANVAATAYDHHVVLINSAADLATTAGFNAIFGTGAGQLALLTTNAQQAVLIEGLAGAGNDKMYYITHDAAGTHATQVATLVGVGQFAGAGDIHVA